MKTYPPVNVPQLADFSLPLSQLIRALQRLQDLHGKNATIATDSGPYNVSFVVHPTKAPRVRCPECKRRVILTKAQTLAKHSRRTGSGFRCFEPCPASNLWMSGMDLVSMK